MTIRLSGNQRISILSNGTGQLSHQLSEAFNQLVVLHLLRQQVVLLMAGDGPFLHLLQKKPFLVIVRQSLQRLHVALLGIAVEVILAGLYLLGQLGVLLCQLVADGALHGRVAGKESRFQFDIFCQVVKASGQVIGKQPIGAMVKQQD